MRELNFDSELCKVCQEHIVCDAQSEEVVEEMAELTFFNEFSTVIFDVSIVKFIL